MVKALANAVTVAVEDLYGATNYIIANVKIIEKIRSLKAIKHRIFYEKHGN